MKNLGLTKDKLESITRNVERNLSKIFDIPNGFEINMLSYSENIVYLIKFNNFDEKRILRLHRPNYISDNELLGEIKWINELKEETNIRLPDTYKGRNGKYIQYIDIEGIRFRCSMIGFLKGCAAEDANDEDLTYIMFEIGKILAKLHIQSQNRDKSKRIERFSWDIDDFFKSSARWGSWKSFRDYHQMTNNEYSLLEKAEKKIIQCLEKYGRTSDRYGLIHADLHCSNIIIDEKGLQIFDFDDCGYSWYMYDFGCCLVRYSNPLKLLPYIVEGYETIKKLAKEDKEVLEMFVLLRRIVRLGWAASHSDNMVISSISEEYYKQTYKMADEWLKKQPVTINPPKIKA